jgi:predicted metal-binding transcription factor (methanogenesis marker protein 9)
LKAEPPQTSFTILLIHHFFFTNTRHQGEHLRHEETTIIVIMVEGTDNDCQNGTTIGSSSEEDKELSNIGFCSDLNKSTRDDTSCNTSTDQTVCDTVARPYEDAWTQEYAHQIPHVDFTLEESTNIHRKIYSFLVERKWMWKNIKPQYMAIYGDRFITFLQYRHLCMFYFKEFKESFGRQIPLELATRLCFARLEKSWVIKDTRPEYLKRSIRKIGGVLYERFKVHSHLYFHLLRKTTRTRDDRILHPKTLSVTAIRIQEQETSNLIENENNLVQEDDSLKDDANTIG